MSEIKLFSIKNDVKQLIPLEVLLEKELQNLIEDNMEKFFGVRFLTILSKKSPASKVVR